jgi:hypothetical protein
MTSEFFCLGAFKLPLRTAFVLYGDIRGGEISIHDVAQIAPNDRHDEFSFVISSVEFVDDTIRGITHVGLVHACKNEEEMDRLTAMDIKNETVLVYPGRASEQIL